MNGLTDDITDCTWVDIFTTWYVLVDDAYQTLVTPVGRLRQRGPARRALYLPVEWTADITRDQ